MKSHHIPQNQITIDLPGQPATILDSKLYRLYTERQKDWYSCRKLFIFCENNSHCIIEYRAGLIENKDKDIWEFRVWIHERFIEEYRKERNSLFGED